MLIYLPTGNWCQTVFVHTLLHSFVTEIHVARISKMALMINVWSEKFTAIWWMQRCCKRKNTKTSASHRAAYSHSLIGFHTLRECCVVINYGISQAVGISPLDIRTGNQSVHIHYITELLQRTKRKSRLRVNHTCASERDGERYDCEWNNWHNVYSVKAKVNWSFCR